MRLVDDQTDNHKAVQDLDLQAVRADQPIIIDVQAGFKTEQIKLLYELRKMNKEPIAHYTDK